MIPDEREGSNDLRTVWYRCGHHFTYIGNVIIESRCPACDAPVGGRA